MVTAYDNVVNELRSSAGMERRRKYLKYSFFAIEFVLSKFARMDMEGYMDHQLGCMADYDEILSEIGEDSTPGWIDKFGPSTRLFIVILQQTLIFVGTKMLCGPAAMAKLASFLSKSAAPKPAPGVKPAMRGPSVNINDI